MEQGLRDGSEYQSYSYIAVSDTELCGWNFRWKVKLCSGSYLSPSLDVSQTDSVTLVNLLNVHYPFRVNLCGLSCAIISETRVGVSGGGLTHILDSVEHFCQQESVCGIESK